MVYEAIKQFIFWIVPMMFTSVVLTILKSYLASKSREYELRHANKVVVDQIRTANGLLTQKDLDQLEDALDQMNRLILYGSTQEEHKSDPSNWMAESELVVRLIPHIDPSKTLRLLGQILVYTSDTESQEYLLKHAFDALTFYVKHDTPSKVYMITVCQQLIWTVMGLESRENLDPSKGHLKRSLIRQLSEEPTGTGLLLQLYMHISFRVPQLSQIAPKTSQLRLQSSIIELVLFTLQRAHELEERRMVEEIVIMCLMDNEALMWATLGRKRFEEYLKIRKTYFVGG